MRALVQRVTEASVVVNGEAVGHIGPGLVVLLGVARTDSEADAAYLVDKIVNLRIFTDGQDPSGEAQERRFERSALDVEAELLIVSQFTMYAETRKGRRPDFTQAAPPQEAQRLYDYVVNLFRQSGLKTATGLFQEHMLLTLRNDGPVTIMLDSGDRTRPRRAKSTD